MQNQDGKYNYRPWDHLNMEDQPVDYGIRFTDREKALTAKALESVLTPAELLADIVRPELPQVALFRPKFGYRTRQLSLMDVLDTDHTYAEDTPADDFGFLGSSRNTNGSSEY